MYIYIYIYIYLSGLYTLYTQIYVCIYCMPIHVHAVAIEVLAFLYQFYSLFLEDAYQ